MQHTPHSLMIFAAGLGTRMGVLTQSMPKPLIKVAGKALIDHALDLAQPIALDQIVVNAHYLADQITDHVADRDILISDETEKLLETGGGLKKARPLLKGNAVLILNSDAVWKGDNPLITLLKHWDASKMDALVLLIPKAQAAGHSGAGDFIRAGDGTLTRGPGDVYVGASILAMNRLDDVPEAVFSLNTVWDIIQAEQRLYGCVYDGQWCDVGTPDGIEKAETLLKAGT
jgi:MurNAc alpha-1-phosphate uridylyltransferase